jgi:hypothetical protein
MAGGEGWPTDMHVGTSEEAAFQADGEGIRRIASRQSAGTHWSAITQKSLHGGSPVYSTNNSKLLPVGNRFPNSHALTVDTETLRSWAIFLRGILRFSRHAVKAHAKLARTSQ